MPLLDYTLEREVWAVRCEKKGCSIAEYPLHSVGWGRAKGGETTA